LLPVSSKNSRFKLSRGADHVFADSLCLSLGCSPDLTVNVETCVAPAENLLDKMKESANLLKSVNKR